MKSGIYTVDAIEKGLVKVLYRTDESIEELISLNEFPFEVKEGDIVEITVLDGGIKASYLKENTEDVKAYVKSLKEKLLNKNKE